MTNKLDVLFRPRSIAVIGASAEVRRIGGRPVDFLKRSGFEGPIYPVNPRRDEVQGLRAYPSVAEIPGPVDHAIISVPVQDALSAIEACIAKGIKGGVMFTSGFREVSESGKALEDAIVQRCREGGFRLLGPNSLGFINVRDKVFSSFTGAVEISWPTPGNIGIASQSGAFGMYCYTRLADRDIGISHFIATGNEADVDVAESIAWLAEDPTTDVILAYLESCRDGARLRDALALARARNKPVVVMKVGVSDIGALAAASHTGALAGSDAGFQAVFEETGAYRAGSMDEMLDVAQAAAQGVLPKGRRVGIISVSGGAGVLLSDAASEFGLEVPVLPEAAQAQIKEMIPFSSPRNPIDATAQVRNDFSVFGRILDVGVEQGNFDIIVTFFAYSGQEPNGMDGVKSALFSLRQRYPNIPIFVSMSATPEVRREFEAAGLLVFPDPRQVMRVASALAYLGEERAPIGPRDLGKVSLPERDIDEATAKALLSKAGIPFVRERKAATQAEAADAADALGFPVALKVLSPDIAHKSDVGGVRLNLRNRDEVVAAWTEMMEAVRRNAPQARLEGALVAPMIGGGIETVLGVHRDPIFGPMVMFGVGGIFVEVFRDVVFGLAPLDMPRALAMIEKIKGRALLEGARGRPPADKAALAEALVALSRFAADHADAIESIDINPFISLPEGGIAVDAVVVKRK